MDVEKIIQEQDDSTMRSMLGLGEREPIPPRTLDAYFRIRRMKHRVAGGPLSVDTLLLVIEMSGLRNGQAEVRAELERVGVATATDSLALRPDQVQQDPEPLPPKEEVKLPGREAPDTGNIIMLEDKEYYVRYQDQWHTLKYKGQGFMDQLKFADPADGRKIISVKRTDFRIKD